MPLHPEGCNPTPEHHVNAKFTPESKENGETSRPNATSSLSAKKKTGASTNSACHPGRYGTQRSESRDPLGRRNAPAAFADE
jgi:hypothetical protein